MILLPKAHIMLTLLEDTETGKLYKFIPPDMLEIAWTQEGREWEQSTPEVHWKANKGTSNPGPEHDR